jgi:hypothetical protein
MMNSDDKRLSNPLVAPHPPDYTNLPNEDRKDLIQYTYIQQLGYHLYTMAMGKFNPVHFRALQHPYLPIRNNVIKQVDYPWDAELVSLHAALIRITQVWEQLVESSELPYPIHFTNDEVN